GARHLLERIGTVLDGDRAHDPVLLLRGRDEQPVVRADEEPPVAGLERGRPPPRADAWIDDGGMDPARNVLDRVRGHGGALQDAAAVWGPITPAGIATPS